MDRNEYLNDPHVRGFVAWAAQVLCRIQVNFAIPRSAKVPGGVADQVAGLDEVLECYLWRPRAHMQGSWEETVATLGALRNSIRAARDDQTMLAACRAILAWGGNRNWNTGAWPFLQAKGEQQELTRYIQMAREWFRLDQVILHAQPPIELMNAMLTKVHALASPDGLPIYDSRVAAAIASLVEMWRRQADGVNALPDKLAFPSTDPDRTVNHLFDDAPAPRILRHGATNPQAMTRHWTEAKVRLGWLIGAILDANPHLLAGQAENRMHAFEASLFMIGYDVRCLRAAND